MARRGSSPSRGSPAFGRGRSPSPSAARRPSRPAAPAQPKAVAPQPPPPTQVAQPTMAASPGGGMMANIATTAAGVAIGHTMGHALTGALGMRGNHSEPATAEQAVAPQQQYQPQSQQAPGQNPCQFELDQFLQCAQNQSNDLSLCDGFNQVLRECKVRYGGQMYQ